MSSSFSTITPLTPATISRKPAYTIDNPSQTQQPVASYTINDYDAPQKKSHTLRNTVIGLAVLAAATAVLRGNVDVFKNFDKTAELAGDAKILDKAAHYGKKGVAMVGDFIIENGTKALNWVKELPSKLKKPAAEVAEKATETAAAAQ